MKTLYVINSPSWTEIDPSGLNNSEMFGGPLSENFTYFYYNLMKFGLVNEVKIFVENHRWRVGKYVSDTLITDFGKMKLLKDDNKFDIINSDKSYNFVFCWSNILECQNIKNKFVIVDNQFNGYIKKSDVNSQIHDFVLSESQNFIDKYIPKDVPSFPYKLISYDHENVKSKTNNQNKIYDWVMISSFDKRKRHIEFLNLLKRQSLSKLKGCIIARDPNNKKKKIFDHLKRNTPWKIYNVVQRLKKNMNFDLFLNIHQDKKIELTNKSKVFVNCSVLDSGPRAQVEAMQLNIPVITMPHVGSSDIIQNGRNGIIAERFSDIPSYLLKIINNYSNFDRISNDDYLKPENLYPNIVKNIQLNYKKKNVQ